MSLRRGMHALTASSSWLAAALLVGALPVGVIGCANIFDVDKEYQRAPTSGAGGTSTTASSSSSSAGGSTTSSTTSGQGGTSGCMTAGDCSGVGGGDPACATPVCNAGSCAVEFAAARTDCSGQLCDGNGNCVECLQDDDCKGKNVCDAANTCQ